MDDYYHLAIILLSISSTLLLLVALYKVAFDFLSNKDVSMFNGRAKHRIEKLFNDKERLSLTVIQIYAILIPAIAICLNYLLNRIVFTENIYLFSFAKIAIISTFIIVIKNTIPFIFSSLRIDIIKLFTPIARVIITIFKPTTHILYKVKSIGFNIENSSAMGSISMDELSDAVEIVSKANTPEEKRILTGMVRFVNADVSDIMCHRTDMVAINIDSSFEEVMDTIKNSGFSRIPVYRDVLDNIIGILYAKDILQHIGKDDFDWQLILRKPYFVSDTKMINELLVKFQKKKIHLAIVVDEYGSTQGIVSLEDILEEIVGEIEDESDIEERFYSQIDENNYVFEGKTPLSDFIEVLKIDTDSFDEIRGDAETLAGLIVELRQDVPKVGSDITIPSYKLRVVKMDKYRIDRIKVTKIDRNAAD